MPMRHRTAQSFVFAFCDKKGLDLRACVLLLQKLLVLVPCACALLCTYVSATSSVICWFKKCITATTGIMTTSSPKVVLNDECAIPQFGLGVYQAIAGFTSHNYNI